jgi:hypothetical protein
MRQATQDSHNEVAPVLGEDTTRRLEQPSGQNRPRRGRTKTTTGSRRPGFAEAGSPTTPCAGR